MQRGTSSSFASPSRNINWTAWQAEGSSFLLTFPLTEAEQRAAGASHVVLLTRRKMRRPRRLPASRTGDLGAG